MPTRRQESDTREEARGGRHEGGRRRMPRRRKEADMGTKMGEMPMSGVGTELRATQSVTSGKSIVGGDNRVNSNARGM